jgi:hypothetical protein
MTDKPVEGESNRLPPSAHISVPLWFSVVPGAALICMWALYLVLVRRLDSLGHFLSGTFSASVYCCSAVCAGHLLFTRIVKTPTSIPIRILLSFTLGLSIFYHLNFLIGALHGFSARYFMALAILPGVLIFHPNNMRAAMGHFRRRISLTRTECVFIILVSMIVFYSFLISLNPVIYYDALTNHVAVPIEYLLRGGIERIPYNLHADLPPASHLNNLTLIGAFGNAETVQIFNFFQILFVGLASCCLTQRKDIVKCLAGYILFLLIPQVSLLFSLCNIDFLVTLFCSAAFIVSLQIDSFGPKAVSILLAIHLSFLLALKYQAGIFVFVLFVILLGNSSRVLFRKHTLFLFLVLFIALVSTFLLKNYLFTGDPVFPFLNRVFTISSVKPEEVGFFISENSGQNGFLNIATIFRTLVNAFYRQPETGALVILLMIVALLYRRVALAHKGKLLALALIPIVIHSCLSSNSVNVIRWTQYSYYFLCILAGFCIVESFKPGRWLSQALFGVLLILSFGLSFTLNWKLVQSIKVSTGMVSEEQYRTRFIPSLELREQLQDLKGRILFIGESRDFMNAENSTVPSAHNSYYIEPFFQNVRSLDQLNKSFKSQGFQYLFVTIPEINKNLKTGRYQWMTKQQSDLLNEMIRKQSLRYDGRSSIVELR